MVKFREIFSDKRQIISVLVILIVKHQNPSLDGATQGDFEITHTENTILMDLQQILQNVSQKGIPEK